MSIEFKIQSVTLQSEDLQEQFPNLIPSINYFLQSQNIPKKRKYRKRKTVGSLIDEIIADVEK